MKITDHQNTKIVATVGPACSSKEGLKSLIHAGVDVFRLNFSHGSHEVHGQVIQNIVELNKELNTHVSILADLQGPKLRVGKMEGDGLPVKEGQVITFTNTECVGNAERIYMSYDQFAADVTVGEKVLVDDGTLVFEVIETNGKDTVKLKTLFGGVLKSNKGVNLPNTKISLPSMTEKDHRDLKYILTQPVNWIALSFV
ncbi:MAG: pyruvate kinase, partial [Bacteroidota bacterium]